MDNAVALVEAYLRVNGYLTVTEFPVVTPLRAGGYAAATDLDVLAFRFGRARALGRTSRTSRDDPAKELPPVDPALDPRSGLSDMIIGEVKEGRAVLNRGAADRGVLSAALARFGCCDPEEQERAVRGLLRRGRAELPQGHRVRLIAFGGAAPERTGGKFDVILLGHVIDHLVQYMRRHWSILQASETKDRALGLLKLLEKMHRLHG